MEQSQQIAIVSEFTVSILSDVITKINTRDIPDSWDGIELRWYLRDRLIDECSFGSSERYKDKRMQYKRDKHNMRR